MLPNPALHLTGLRPAGERQYRWGDEAANVFRVIDTVEHRAEWTHRYPEIDVRGEGLLVILESSEHVPEDSLKGQSVAIERLDGTVSDFVVAGVAWGANKVPGLFFQGIRSADVPRGSMIRRS